ncbi:hypothetical protein C0584_02380 [Candidatus Parcubacteria bacterium]|nr:MAG: hypothetical protein C0584_02380 [Candidatus Parcubacteria bacterium]
MKKITSVLLLLLASTLLLSGCGGGGGSQYPSFTPTSQVYDGTTQYPASEDEIGVVKFYFSSDSNVAAMAAAFTNDDTDLREQIIDIKRSEIVGFNVSVISYDDGGNVLKNYYFWVPVVAGVAQAEMEGIIADDYTIWVEAEDATGAKTFYGHADVTVYVGQTTNTTVPLLLSDIEVNFVLQNLAGTYIPTDSYSFDVRYNLGFDVYGQNSSFLGQEAVDGINFSMTLPYHIKTLTVAISDSTNTTYVAEIPVDLSGAVLGGDTVYLDFTAYHNSGNIYLEIDLNNSRNLTGYLLSADIDGWVSRLTDPSTEMVEEFSYGSYVLAVTSNNGYVYVASNRGVTTSVTIYTSDGQLAGSFNIELPQPTTFAGGTFDMAFDGTGLWVVDGTMAYHYLPDGTIDKDYTPPVITSSIYGVDTDNLGRVHFLLVDEDASDTQYNPQVMSLHVSDLSQESSRVLSANGELVFGLGYDQSSNTFWTNTAVGSYDALNSFTEFNNAGTAVNEIVHGNNHGSLDFIN